MLSCRISSTADVATRERDISAAVGFKLYCVAPTGGSLVFSPYSIAAGLSMLLLGSRGESAVELGTALGYVIPWTTQQCHPLQATPVSNCC